MGSNSKEGFPSTITTTGDDWHSSAYCSRFALASSSLITFMRLKLLALHQSTIASFLANYLHGDETVCRVNVVEHPKVPETQLPTGDGVWAQGLEAPGPRTGLVTQMQLHAIQNNRLCVSVEPFKSASAPAVRLISNGSATPGLSIASQPWSVADQSQTGRGARSLDVLVEFRPGVRVSLFELAECSWT